MEVKIENYAWKKTDYLGEGGFGQVFKGRNIKNGQVVAIKVLNMSDFNNKFLIDSLKTEIYVMKQLKSNNVLHLLDVYGNKQYTFIVLEFCNQGDLRKFAQKKGGKFMEIEAISILQQIMIGFKELIQLGYIHRDVKPDNVLIHDNVCKLSDFGFAKKVDIQDEQYIREVVGTQMYMAPQLLENQKYTAKCDIWSLGMMYYEMLFGKTPWPCRDKLSYLNSIKTVRLRIPYQIAISQYSLDFLQKCLVTNEKKRIDWDELFQHPILQSDIYDKINQTSMIIPENIFNEQTQKIMRQLQEVAQEKNLNYYNFIKEEGQEFGGFLTKEEFQKFLKKIDRKISLENASVIFNQLIQQNQTKLEIDYFWKFFAEYDFSDVNDRATQIITDLREIVKQNKLNLHMIFHDFDMDHENGLDYDEFKQMLKSFAPGLKEFEIKQCFKKFDKNQDGSISFIEFYKLLAYGLKKDNDKQKRQQFDQLIKKLNEVIIENKLDLRQIFNNFDKNRDNQWDFDDFCRMALVVDQTLQKNEIMIIFDYFDSNNDGVISFNEFQECLDKKQANQKQNLQQ